MLVQIIIEASSFYIHQALLVFLYDEILYDDM